MLDEVNEIEQLARPEIVALAPYRSARTDAGTAATPILLDANERPGPPRALAEAALPAHRYPEPQPRALRERFARAYGVAPEAILLTRGASEAIDLLVRVFCAPGRDRIVVAPPTFELYELAATVHGALTHVAPLTDDGFQLDVERLLCAVRRNPGVKLVFLCTPNNPTGNLLRRADVLRLCAELRGRALVVADQTYVAFSGEAPLSDELHAHPNLVVLRTLSKEHGLAGERVGVTVADPVAIDLLRRVVAPYPLPQSAVAAVLAATTPAGSEEARRAVAEVVAERERVAAALRAAAPFARVHPSDANFLLVEVPRPELLIAATTRAGIAVRDRSDVEGLAGCVRITIGAAHENDALLAAFADFASALRLIGAHRAGAQPAAAAIRSTIRSSSAGEVAKFSRAQSSQPAPNSIPSLNLTRARSSRKRPAV